MNATCRSLRQRVAALGANALDDDARVERHLATCDGCRRAIAALTTLDEAIHGLEPIDAPDALVEGLLAKVATEPMATQESGPGTFERLVDVVAWLRGWFLVPVVKRSLATAALATFAVAVGVQLKSSERGTFVDSVVRVDQAGALPDEQRRVAEQKEELEKIPTSRDPWAVLTNIPGVQTDRINVGDDDATVGDEVEDLVFPAPKRTIPKTVAPPFDASPFSETLEEAQAGAFRREAAHLESHLESVDTPTPPAPPAVPASAAPPAGSKPPASLAYGQRGDGEAVRDGQAPPRKNLDDLSKQQPATISEEITVVGEAPVPVTSSISVGHTVRQEAPESSTADMVFDIPGEDERVGRVAPGRQAMKEHKGKANDDKSDQLGAFKDADSRRSGVEANASSGEGQQTSVWEIDGATVTDLGAIGSSPTYYNFETNLAQEFLAERAKIDGLTFQAASGYWSNTYVPGDPALRLLSARMARRDPAILQAFGDHPLRLHDAVRPPSYPFDPPRNAAMALYVDTDRPGLGGPGRTLIRVGLRATDRFAGQRPQLDLAVVVDLETVPETEASDSLRALLRALVETAEPGDRFRLFFAGRDVAPISPDGFRHGPVSLAFEDALAAPAADVDNLAAVLAAATTQLNSGAGSDLGATALMLVTGRSDVDELEAWVHRSAVAGVPVSVVGLGDAVDREALTGLALAGQGRLWHLLRPADAAAVVAREIDAVSQIVARALRLQIRLAPGVELVDVVGAERLDLAAAARVREAEQSIDQRLARDLGIAANRGEDEDGIQIVIPAFYARDSHVVLLDVVAPGPGRVADVTLRYKDLVRSKNGTARARLKLGRSETVRRGATRQRLRSVLKSLLAFKVQAGLRAAADDLIGDPAGGWDLRHLHQLLTDFQALDAGWGTDRDLRNDLAVIADYLAVLEAGAAEQDPTLAVLIDSLRLASGRKLLEVPAVAGSE